MINRIFLIVLDSLGVGALPDAEKFNDKGANTLGHILNALGKNFSLPNLEKLGLYNILSPQPSKKSEIIGSYGKLACASPAKDSTCGHWELAGIIMKKPLPIFPKGFPEKLIRDFENKIGTKIIGNCAASGTEIIKRMGKEHLETGYPIVYTSADSVFQIACHEEKFGLNKLYGICKTARKMLTGSYSIGRVIARPFVGKPGSFTRTENRKDYSISPPEPTILDNIKKAGGNVTAIGKIIDIFNGQGITREVASHNNDEGMNLTLKEVINKPDPKLFSLVFINLVDFDMLWGHRRDAVSYAKGLREFDSFIHLLIPQMQGNDLLIITADHGCDPTYTKHTDHTREYVPLMVYSKKIKPGVNLGTRPTFADVAQTIADIFNLDKIKNGTSFKSDILNI
ncbi:MAG: phosphopentomutase [Endomicrobiales bacterium]|nr:phosphopentomutase [Endomicrobiales bacterium]